MRTLICGADGYLGWPTAMSLSTQGHEILGVDNYLRRRLSKEEDVQPLFPTPNLHLRSKLWQAISGKTITIRTGDLTDWTFTSRIFQEFQPEAVIHYAEQPSAPYSMMGRKQAALTLNNNLNTTLNIILAVKEFTPNAHIIKLGTMGEYGTPNIDIEEGWLEVQHKGRKHTFLYPRQPGSLYHTTKVMDTDLLWFYVRTWGIKVTDLMQGPVYGLYTKESAQDDRLLPHLYYDEIFGTVLNRFLVQAVAGYPLTVYGKGGQIRGYLNIKDTMNCIKLSLETPPNPGQLRIFNQFTETFSVNQLAKKVQSAAKNIGCHVQIKPIDNPRIEPEEHYYSPVHTGLIELGLKPHYLTEQVLEDMLKAVKIYQDRIDITRIVRDVKWSR